MKTAKTTIKSLALSMVAISTIPVAVFAEVPHPYNKLQLSPVQRERIEDLDHDWKNRYSELGPRLQAAQNHLMKLLATPKSDPLEITSAQQRVNQLKEQLSEMATANYLKKRRLLNEGQQKELEGHLRRMVAERGRNKS